MNTLTEDIALPLLRAERRGQAVLIVGAENGKVYKHRTKRNYPYLVVGFGGGFAPCVVKGTANRTVALRAARRHNAYVLVRWDAVDGPQHDKWTVLYRPEVSA